MQTTRSRFPTGMTERKATVNLLAACVTPLPSAWAY
jgi:hypothetical protein